MLSTAGQVLFNGQHRPLSYKKKRERRVPAAIHIRQPSLSSSVSSAESLSTRSTHSLSSSHRHEHEEPVEFDPLSLHPTFHPPARLSERPFILTDDDDVEPRLSQEEEDEWKFLREGQIRLEGGKALPALPLDTPTPMSPANANANAVTITETHTGHERDETEAEAEGDGNMDGGDYFTLQKETPPDQRPTLLRSHWSESTIMTLDGTPTPQEREIRQPTQARWQNFSYKRATVPKRPPMKTMDSIENFIKRGGWKRRGIVFHQDPPSSRRASEQSLFGAPAG
jgi:hypothetical protein